VSRAAEGVFTGEDGGEGGSRMPVMSRNGLWI